MASEGKIVYTDRAFQQDAELAIQNDIVRALIELITNSDDAYGDVKGSIYVEMIPTGDAGVIDVRVTDAAKGLARDALVEKFTKLGGKNAEFMEGDNSRELLGRGAKDVASLGGVTFKSIHQNKYSELHLAQSGNWKFLVENTDVTQDHRKAMRLGEAENGLTVVIHVLPQIKMPKGAKLQSYLSTHTQLRDIIIRHDLFLIDKREGGFSANAVPRISEFTPILDEALEIPGYPGEAKIKINRLKNMSKTSLNEFSEHGLLIKSGKTIYQNTLFGNESHPFAGLIAGEIYAPQINQLVRDYDNGEIVDGGRLITRDRDGLAPNHPFTRALNKAVQVKLIPILKELLAENEKNQGQGENLTQALKDAASALRHEVNDFLKELEDPSHAGLGDNLEPISAIPPKLNLETDSSGWLTIRVNKETPSKPKTIVGMDIPKGVISALVPNEVNWKKHERLDVYQTSIQIQSGSDLGSGVVTIYVDNESVNVPVVVRDLPDDPVVIPTELRFTTDSARIAPTRTRKLLLVAPLEECDREVDVAVLGVEVASYDAKAILRLSDNALWCEAFVSIKASLAVGELNVTASLAGHDDALTKLKIEESGPLGGIDLDFELVSGSNRPRRVNVWNNAGTITIHVEADHPSYSGVFGTFDKELGKYTEEDSAPARVALAEALARGLAEYLIEQEAIKKPQEYSDGAKFFNRAHEFTNKFVKKFNAAFVS